MRTRIVALVWLLLALVAPAARTQNPPASLGLSRLASEDSVSTYDTDTYTDTDTDTDSDDAALELELERELSSATCGLNGPVDRQQSQLGELLDQLVPPGLKWYILKGRIRRTVNWYTKKARDLVNSFVKPKQEFYYLVKRYRKWWSAYQAHFQAAQESANEGSEGCSAEPRLLAPRQLFLNQFAKVDSALFESKFEKAKLELDPELEDEDDARLSVERAEHLFDALQQLIGRLEAILADIQSDTPRGREHLAPAERSGGALDGDPVVKYQFKESMGRLKRITTNKIKDVVYGEVMELSKVALLNLVAAWVMSAPPGSWLSLLAPIFNTIVGPDITHTTLASEYALSLQIRTALKLLVPPLRKMAVKAAERENKNKRARRRSRKSQASSSFSGQ